MSRVKLIFQIMALHMVFNKFSLLSFPRVRLHKLLDPSNHLHIQTCTLQVEEDKKNMSRMQTLMDNLQLKVQTYKQQIEAVVST